MSKNPTRKIRVAICNTGKVYTTYEDMAKHMKLRNWSPKWEDRAKELYALEGTLITVKRHLGTRVPIAAVRLDLDGSEVIIGVEGIQFI